jgi:hypothetical protein
MAKECLASRPQDRWERLARANNVRFVATDKGQSE